MFRGTTILSVRRGDKVVIGGDGQVTLGNTVMKGNARKVRRLYHDKVIAGFAGATADAFTLFEHFEGKLEKHRGNLTRAAVAKCRAKACNVICCRWSKAAPSAQNMARLKPTTFCLLRRARFMSRNRLI